MLDLVSIGDVGGPLHDIDDDGADRQRTIIESLGLPTSAAGLDRAAVRTLVAKDKKRDSAGLRMVLLEAVGRPVLRTVDAPTLDVALAAVGL